jgi:hypothetical protein
MGNPRLPLMPARIFREIKGFPTLLIIGTVNRISCEWAVSLRFSADLGFRVRLFLPTCAIDFGDEAPRPTSFGPPKSPRFSTLPNWLRVTG